MAFGFRNLTNYRAGLMEMRRDFEAGRHGRDIWNFPRRRIAVLARLYGFYSRRFCPLIGGMISGSKDAYTYLPESVRKFPDAEGLADQMRDAGFVNVRFERMTAGIVALHLGDRG